MSDLITPDIASHFLDGFFTEHLPITAYLQMKVDQFDGKRFSLAMPLQPSLNDKLTAFGGSLYVLSVSNGWGMVYLQARMRGINPNLVVSHAEIDYLKPVDDEIIIASCQQPNDTYWDDFFNDFNAGKKVKAVVNSTISCGGKDAVRFQGQYAIVGIKD